jgi:hypothetical protein
MSDEGPSYIRHNPEYVEKYVLSEEKYKSDWRPVQKEVFRLTANPDDPVTPPDQVFQPGFQFRFRWAGAPFHRDYINMLRGFMQEIGETSFIVSEHPWEPEKSKWRDYRFPADITWEEFRSGGMEAERMLIILNSDLYAFGESGRWGIYICQGLNWDVIGLKSDDLVYAFDRHFGTSAESSVDAVATELSDSVDRRSEKNVRTRLKLFGEVARNYLTTGRS